MLLAGYKKGGRAIRLEKVGDGFQTVSFEVFGPKCLACINGLPPALASRSIVVPMFRAEARLAETQATNRTPEPGAVASVAG